MGASNNQELRDLLFKTLAFADSSAEESIAEAALGLTRTEEVFYKVAADSGASDTTLLWAKQIKSKIQITQVTIMPLAALTADNTNNKIVSLEVDDGAGGSDTQIAAKTTTVANGNWVAGTAFDLTLSATTANHVVDGATATKWLIFKLAINGTGVVCPACKMYVTYKFV
jgi:hypothetical protein